MRIRAPDPRALLRGGLIAAALAVAARVASGLLWGRDWYFAILLGVCSGSCLLLAWLLYLREDGVAARRDGVARAAEEPRGSAPSASPGGATPPPGMPELALFAPRDRLVERASPPPPRAGASDEERAGITRRALAWAALALGLLSAALYLIAGVGASYYL